MNVVSTIIQKFGSRRALADAVGVSVWTVRDWEKRGHVPRWPVQQSILEAGRDLSDPVVPGDFFAHTPKAEEKQHE